MFPIADAVVKRADSECHSLEINLRPASRLAKINILKPSL